MEKQDEIIAAAKKVLKLAHDSITIRYRYLDTAMAKLKTELKEGINSMYTNGEKMYFDPVQLLVLYTDEPGVAVRSYLHMLMHSIFMHQFQYDKTKERYWNIATDVAVENIILELEFPRAALTRDAEEADRIMRLKKRVPELTAEKIYREFLVNPPSEEYMLELERLFTIDNHGAWKNETEELIITEEQWKKITQRIKTELEAFNKNKGNTESLEKSLMEATKEHYDYTSLIQRFMVMGEEITVNDDEFDYIYYTYGLKQYGNMPLIEPLEYKEEKRIKEIVIAIDTSASCRGDIVKAFIQKTYELLKQTENYFHKINLHIIQCDAQIQSDVKITDEHEFEEYINNIDIKGSGGTDFRPVFEYVDMLTHTGEFENLKGLIYFTDGYGVYPERMPQYDVIFAFLYDDPNREQVPDWAIKVIMEDELNEH